LTNYILHNLCSLSNNIMAVNSRKMSPARYRRDEKYAQKFIERN
jgi:hypothetical protein